MHERKGYGMARELLPQGYDDFLRELKERIRHAQLHAAFAVNRELVLLYWRMGREISQRMQAQGWGAKVVDRLARDLHAEFPAMKGFSPRNLRYMRAFAEAYSDEAMLQEVPATLSWYHNTTLLDKLDDADERLWYARQAMEHGWSRNVLVHQIESGLYHRQGQAVTNFDRTLPPPQSDLARQMLKDPYVFDFLSLGSEAQERDLERGLLAHLRDFLLELGVGFAFVGSQYHLEVGDQDFYLDLLFYHLRLRCYVVIDLKIGDFQPEYAGKMNFYLSAVNDLLRHTDDQPSIGIILCKGRNRVIAEYALRDMHAPLGVATYRLTAALPDALKDSLPDIGALEAHLTEADTDNPPTP
jgi:predicted nuclease of restriction endonuclease-like (RecB) superfamily